MLKRDLVELTKHTLSLIKKSQIVLNYSKERIYVELLIMSFHLIVLLLTTRVMGISQGDNILLNKMS